MKQMVDNSEQFKKRVERMTCGNRWSDIYIDGVKEFLNFAFSNIPTSTNGEEYKVPILVNGATIVIVRQGKGLIKTFL